MTKAVHDADQKKAGAVREPNADTALNRLSTKMVSGSIQPYLGGVILRLRKEAQLSQGELAQKSKVDRGYLGQIERGRCEPTISVLFKISASLGKKPSGLVELVEDEMEKPDEPHWPIVKRRPPLRYLEELTLNDKAHRGQKVRTPQSREDVSLRGWPLALKKAMASRSDFRNQTALAKRSGVPQSTVGRILRGDVEDPQVSTLERIASAFGMSLGQLAGMSPGVPPVAEPTTDLATLAPRRKRTSLPRAAAARR